MASSTHMMFELSSLTVQCRLFTGRSGSDKTTKVQLGFRKATMFQPYNIYLVHIVTFHVPSRLPICIYRLRSVQQSFRVTTPYETFIDTRQLQPVVQPRVEKPLSFNYSQSSDSRQRNSKFCPPPLPQPTENRTCPLRSRDTLLSYSLLYCI